MTKIQIDLSGVGGLTPSSPKGTANLIAYGADNQFVSGAWNPFPYPGFPSGTRALRKTMVQSAATLYDITAIYDKTSGKFLTGGFGTSGPGKINIYTTPDTTTATSNFTQYATGGIYDFEIYQLNGVRKIFVASYDIAGVAGYVGVTDGTTFTYNWSNGATSTLYTGTVVGSGTFPTPPFLRLASNGFMYIFSSNGVHKVDGTTTGGTGGTITANALTLSATQMCVDAVDYKNMMYIAVQNVGGIAPTPSTDKYEDACGVMIWDRVSTQVGTRDFITLGGLKSINRLFIGHDGKMRMICTTNDTSVQLREFNGTTFETIFEFGNYAAPQWWDQLCVTGYATMWVGNDSKIYAHGRAGFGFPNAVYVINAITGATVDMGQRGFLYYVNGSEGTNAEAIIYNFKTSAGSESTTEKKLFNYVNSSGSLPSGYSGSLSNAIYEELKTKVYKLPFSSSVNDVIVYFAPCTGSASTEVVGSIKLYFNNSTTAFKTINLTRNDVIRGYYSIPVNKHFVHCVQIGIDFSTFTTNAANKIGISAEMFAWYAVLDYTATHTLK